MEYGRFLVLSLGTGSAKSDGKYDADEAAKWGIIGWLTSDHSSPLLDVFTQASGGMVDFHISTFFQALNCEENYLRIQDDTLTGTLTEEICRCCHKREFGESRESGRGIVKEASFKGEFVH
ncbi:hypothetical protein OIU84_028507 [Salix udensis]|uniref:Patatin n=1 Tax=Salix udensis TaxID=889485 RepID=A0AAD6P8M7_9ROSI|nr:hypothetical protein OIU84_028507 [Salix udensis]